jgi:RNA recognition motif-containing protein
MSETERYDERSRSRSPQKSGKRVFVGNLAYKVRWQDLKDFMMQCIIHLIRR